MTSYQEFQALCLSTNFQKARHIGSTEEVLQSVYYDPFSKVTWSARIPVKISPTEVGPPDEKTQTRKVTYLIPETSPYHGLGDTYIGITLPAITFRPGFQGRWCRNPVINIMTDITLYHNGVRVTGFESTCIDHCLQTLTNDDAIRDAGNIPALQKWSNRLPEFKGRLTLPWFFSFRQAKFFPLYLCFCRDKLEYRITIRTNLSELIEVQKDEFLSSPIMFEADKHLAGPVSVPTPVLYNEFIIMTDAELLSYYCSGMHKKLMFTDFIRLDNPDQIAGTRAGEIISLNISTKFPVHCLFWCLTKQNHLSNYTDSDDYELGSTPIEWSSLKYKETVIFERLEPWQTEGHYPSRRLLRVPAAGYSSFPFFDKYLDSNPKTGMILDGCTFSVKIVDKPGDLSKYYIRLYGLVSKDLEFTRSATSDAERTLDGGLSKIVISGNT